VPEARRLVDVLWRYCNVLRDDGVSTIAYTEELIHLLFLKMTHELETRPSKPERIARAPCSWSACDKANIDITRLKDASLDDLPTPEVIAREIVDDSTAALAEFEAVAAALEGGELRQPGVSLLALSPVGVAGPRAAPPEPLAGRHHVVDRRTQ
jgi:hypothetical protein